MLQNPPPFVNLLHVLQNRRFFLYKNWPYVKHRVKLLLQGLTLKIGSVKRSSPAARAGLWKMDYLISVGQLFKIVLVHNS